MNKTIDEVIKHDNRGFEDMESDSVINYQGIPLKKDMLYQLPTPCYMVIEELLERNLAILKQVMDHTGCHILLAQKAFSMFSEYPLITKFLSGTTASGLFEAKLGREEFGKEVHIYSPAYKEDEFDEIMKLSDHIVFNSIEQWIKYRDKVKAVDKHISCGLRINPEYSEVEVDLYNPCFQYSRFGVTIDKLRQAIEDDPHVLDGIEGFHFHAMCEQGAEVLERVFCVVEEKFSKYFKQLRWINFGGGHHITKPDYNVTLLENIILRVKNQYGVDVYLEPGEAVAIDTGILVTTVLDFVENGMQIALLDTSAACHMPDVLEMPYRPEIIGASNPEEKVYTYRLSSATCLSGDVIGDYSFDHRLQIGERLAFCDMSHYSMVKNNTFNGINLPTIIRYNKKDGAIIVKRFGYDDFKERLS